MSAAIGSPPPTPPTAMLILLSPSPSPSSVIAIDSFPPSDIPSDYSTVEPSTVSSASSTTSAPSDVDTTPLLSNEMEEITTQTPTTTPTMTTLPTSMPSSYASTSTPPTLSPSSLPSTVPPSVQPSVQPNAIPSATPSAIPLTVSPSTLPSSMPFASAIEEANEATSDAEPESETQTESDSDSESESQSDPDPNASLSVCELCPIGTIMKSPDKMFYNGYVGRRTSCEEAQSLGEEGQYDAKDCSFLSSIWKDQCGCVPMPTTSPSPSAPPMAMITATTDSPTVPTHGPTTMTPSSFTAIPSLPPTVIESISPTPTQSIWDDGVGTNSDIFGDDDNGGNTNKANATTTLVNGSNQPSSSPPPSTATMPSSQSTSPSSLSDTTSTQEPTYPPTSANIMNTTSNGNIDNTSDGLAVGDTRSSGDDDDLPVTAVIGMGLGAGLVLFSLLAMMYMVWFRGDRRRPSYDDDDDDDDSMSKGRRRAILVARRRYRGGSGGGSGSGTNAIVGRGGIGGLMVGDSDDTQRDEFDEMIVGRTTEEQIQEQSSMVESSSLFSSSIIKNNNTSSTTNSGSGGQAGVDPTKSSSESSAVTLRISNSHLRYMASAVDEKAIIKEVDEEEGIEDYMSIGATSRGGGSTGGGASIIAESDASGDLALFTTTSSTRSNERDNESGIGIGAIVGGLGVRGDERVVPASTGSISVMDDSLSYAFSLDAGVDHQSTGGFGGTSFGAGDGDGTGGGGVSGVGGGGESATGPSWTGEHSYGDEVSVSVSSRRGANTILRRVVAPPGKLGLVIDTTMEGPCVHKVIATSPLEGSIFPGDIIIAIDDIDTKAMSTSAITDLMVRTANQQRKLTVLSEDV